MVANSPSSIVVGVDGSGESGAALRWALREGVARKIPVEVVHCWQRHSLNDMASGSPHELSRGSESMLESETRAALSGMDAAPRVVRTSVRGRPATVLLHRTEDAVLLVMGAHGHLATRHVPRGPVANMSIKWGFCPVVVVDADNNAVTYGEGRVKVTAG